MSNGQGCLEPIAIVLQHIEIDQQCWRMECLFRTTNYLRHGQDLLLLLRAADPRGVEDRDMTEVRYATTAEPTSLPTVTNGSANFGV